MKEKFSVRPSVNSKLISRCDIGLTEAEPKWQVKSVIVVIIGF